MTESSATSDGRSTSQGDDIRPSTNDDADVVANGSSRKIASRSGNKGVNNNFSRDGSRSSADSVSDHEEDQPGAVCVTGLEDSSDFTIAVTAASNSNNVPGELLLDVETPTHDTSRDLTVTPSGSSGSLHDDELPVALEAETVEKPPLVSAIEHKESGVYDILKQSPKHWCDLFIIIFILIAPIATAVGIGLAVWATSTTKPNNNNGNNTNNNNNKYGNIATDAELAFLRNKGYVYTWESSKGFLTTNPDSATSYWDRNFITQNVTSLQECGTICRNATSISGAWN